MATSVDYDALTRDLVSAKTLAGQAIANLQDGGSANLDCLVLAPGFGSALPRKTSRLVRAVAAAGCQLGGKLRGGYRLDLGIPTGQGDRNTVAVETARDHLTARGWPVYIYYLVD